MKYAFIQRNKLVWPICVQCQVLLVSVYGHVMSPACELGKVCTDDKGVCP